MRTETDDFFREARAQIGGSSWEPDGGNRWTRRLLIPDPLNQISFPLPEGSGFDDYGCGPEGVYLFQRYPRPGGVWEPADEFCEDCGEELETEIIVRGGRSYDGRMRCPTGCLPA